MALFIPKFRRHNANRTANRVFVDPEYKQSNGWSLRVRMCDFANALKHVGKKL